MSSVCVAITLRRLWNELEAKDRVFVHKTVRVTRQVLFVHVTAFQPRPHMGPLEQHTSL